MTFLIRIILSNHHLTGVIYYKKEIVEEELCPIDYQSFLNKNIQIENLKKEIETCRHEITEKEKKIFVEMEERKKAEIMINETILNMSDIIKEKEEEKIEISHLKEKLIENQINSKISIIPCSEIENEMKKRGEKCNEKNNENKNNNEEDKKDGTRTDNPVSRGSIAFKSQLHQCRLIMAEKSRKREKDMLFPRSGLSSDEPRQRERTKLIEPEEGDILIMFTI